MSIAVRRPLVLAVQERMGGFPAVSSGRRKGLKKKSPRMVSFKAVKNAIIIIGCLVVDN
jgi:hypothetical protein